MKEFLNKKEVAQAARVCRALTDALGGGKLSVADTIRKALEIDLGSTEVGGIGVEPGQPVLEVTKDGRIFCGDRKDPYILFDTEVEWVRVEEFHKKDAKGDVMYCYIDGPARHHKGDFFDMTDPEFDFYPNPDSDYYDTVGLLFCDLLAGKRPDEFPIVNDKVTAKDALEYWGDCADHVFGTDLSNDLVDIYEDSTGLSAYHWDTLTDDYVPLKDKERPLAVANRPEEFATCGFTAEYDNWAIHKIAEALRRGFVCVQYITEYIEKYPAIVDDVKLPGWDWEYYEVDFFRTMPKNGKRPVPYGEDKEEDEEYADADYSIAIRARFKPTIETAEKWLENDILNLNEAGVLQVVGPVDEKEIADSYDMKNADNWPIFG